MILLVSNSYDVTSDIVVERLGSQRVFRFNADLWPQYNFYVDVDGFTFADPSGRSVREGEITHLYWRKPVDEWGADTAEEARWLALQRRYALREVCNSLLRSGVDALVEPGAEARVGKLVQLREASRYFHVPEWRVWQGKTPPALTPPVLIKALDMESVGAGRYLYATRVDEAELAPDQLWFSQRCIEATHDVTVVVIDDQCFAYALERPVDAPTDWRMRNAEAPIWSRIDWDESQRARTLKLVRGLGLRFSRLDFVTDARGQLWFLEVNPNGQFAWLDPDGTGGLLAALDAALLQDARG